MQAKAIPPNPLTEFVPFSEYTGARPQFFPKRGERLAIFRSFVEKTVWRGALLLVLPRVTISIQRRQTTTYLISVAMGKPIERSQHLEERSARAINHRQQVFLTLLQLMRCKYENCVGKQRPNN